MVPGKKLVVALEVEALGEVLEAISQEVLLVWQQQALGEGVSLEDQ